MDFEDRISSLKEQVRSLSNEQYSNYEKKEKLGQKLLKIEEENKVQKNEMIDFLKDIFLKNEKSSEKERRLVQEHIEKLYEQQIVMNKKLIELVDCVNNVTSLNELYEEKRSLLLLDYDEYRYTIQEKIKILNGKINDTSNALSIIENNLSNKTKELITVENEIKELSLRKTIKKIITSTWLVFPIILVIQVLITKFFLK